MEQRALYRATIIFVDDRKDLVIDEVEDYTSRFFNEYMFKAPGKIYHFPKEHVLSVCIDVQKYYIKE